MRIRWVGYHSIIMDKDIGLKISMYKAIKESRLRKIYVCNYLLKRAKVLLDIDKEVIIDIRNWYKRKELIKGEIIRNMEGKSIILTSMGIGSKVIISELREEYPENIYIDIGSALDLICTKRDSRGKKSYEEQKEIFAPLLPENWEDPKNNYIFEEAKHKLGIHLN